MNILPVIGGSAFILLGIYLCRQSVRNRRRALASNSWSNTVGKMVAVRLSGKRNIDGKMVDAERIDVNYEYKVNDTLYEGTRVSFYTLMYPETKDFSDQHPINSKVTVYYNTATPADSVLIRGLRPDKPNSDLILAIICLVAGAAVALLGWQGLLG